MATKTNTKTETNQTQGDAADAPLLDNLNAEVKKMIARGKEVGYVTYDQLNAALPPDQVSSEQIEDTMSMLSEAGINVVENEEAEDTPEETKEAEAESTAGNVDENEIGRSDDPVRMYLREMGSVELLSREGEIAIAKRIEAGREMMIGGIVESPMTIRSLLQWRDALDEGLMLLRDIIDLDATYSGPKTGDEDPDEMEAVKLAQAASRAKIEEDDAKEEAAEAAAKNKGEAEAETEAGAEAAQPEGAAKAEGEPGEAAKTESDDDDDDDENTVSLAVMEQTLLPKILGKFDVIKK
jgi:RNA polymerase primary sigma factor